MGVSKNNGTPKLSILTGSGGHPRTHSGVTSTHRHNFAWGGIYFGIFSFFFFLDFFLFLVRWSPGPLIPWCPGHLVPLHLVPSLSGPQCPGPLAPWSSGPLVPWSCGPLVLWSPAPLVFWSPGPLFFFVPFFLTCLLLCFTISFILTLSCVC